MESLEKPRQFTRKDLKSFIDILDSDIDNLHHNPPKNCILEKEVDKRVLELIRKLLEQKELFQRIYRTNNGSFYFVLSDGTSLRFKFEKEKNGVKKYDPQSFMDETIFISQEQYDYIKEKGFQYEIEESDFVEGSVPFEVSGGTNDKPVITSNGLGKVEIDGHNLDKYHFGHPISEIIKF